MASGPRPEAAGRRQAAEHRFQLLRRSLDEKFGEGSYETHHRRRVTSRIAGGCTFQPGDELDLQDEGSRRRRLVS
jgi:hypothetical protein